MQRDDITKNLHVYARAEQINGMRITFQRHPVLVQEAACCLQRRLRSVGVLSCNDVIVTESPRAYTGVRCDQRSIELCLE